MTLEEAWRASGRNKCSNGKYKLCKFEPFYEDEKDIAEVCEQCGRKIGYKKVEGKIDEKQYLYDHVLAHLQPNGPTRNLFLEVYGYAPIAKYKEAMKRKGNARSQDDWIAETRDTYKTVKGLVNSGHKIETI